MRPDKKLDPAEAAIFAAERLFDALTLDEGLPAFDVIAGMHGEIVRRMIVHFGLKETEEYLCVSLGTVAQLADDEAHNPEFGLLHAAPAGSA